MEWRIEKLVERLLDNFVELLRRPRAGPAPPGPGPSLDPGAGVGVGGPGPGLEARAGTVD